MTNLTTLNNDFMKKITALAFLLFGFMSFAQDGPQWQELIRAQEAGKRVQMNISDGNFKAAIHYAKNIILANETLLNAAVPENYKSTELSSQLERLKKLNTQLKNDIKDEGKLKQNIALIEQINDAHRAINSLKR